MPHPSARVRLHSVAILALMGVASGAHAQWLPGYQHYSIDRLGFYDAAHTSSAGTQFSSILGLGPFGQVAGTSNRYIGAGGSNGVDAWVSVGSQTVQVGLIDGSHTGSSGFRNSKFFEPNVAAIAAQLPSGQVCGTSTRYQGVNSANGQDAWVFSNGLTTQIGLTGPNYGGGTIAAYSAIEQENTSGMIVGHTDRYISGTYSGQDSWLWDGSSTRQLGLTGPAYATSAGVAFTSINGLTANGMVAGGTRRFFSDGSNAGADGWLWNGTSTQLVGLMDATHTGSDGRRTHGVIATPTDQIFGASARYLGTSINGQDSWAWNGGAITQVGLTGGAYTGSAGYQSSTVEYSSSFPTNTSSLVGTSFRISGADTINGQDAWIWNGSTTTQIGFSGASYVRGDGYANTRLVAQNSAGQVIGFTTRWNSANLDAGADGWVYTGSSTVYLGLLGTANIGSAGYRISTPIMQNHAGQVAGVSFRFTAASTNNGQDAWAWNGIQTAAIGLAAPNHTGSSGYRYSEPVFQNQAGQIAGYSKRISGEIANNGQNAWVWNGFVTVPVGLTGPANTGTSGYQLSEISFQNAAGQVVGTSRRVTGQFNNNGTDAWYYDPASNLTSPVILSVRSADNYAISIPFALTDNGFLLGQYLLFPGGLGVGDARAYIYRPDLGFTDLGNLVAGGLSAAGWATLTQPQYASALDVVVGYGLFSGQTGGRSVFRLTPTPGAAALLALAPLLTCRRHRRTRDAAR